MTSANYTDEAEPPLIELPSLETVQTARAIQNSKLKTIFCDSGPLSRHNYPKSMEFIRATGKRGADKKLLYTEVGFFGGNRTSKTFTGCFCDAVFLTGRYPEWWEGRRFDGPVKWWVAGENSKTTRDILQALLLGTMAAPASGFILPQWVTYTSNKIGTPGAYDTAYIRHISGGTSELQFRSYEEGRGAFQGTKQDGIHCDEEPPADVYQEMMMRLVATDGVSEDGLMMLTMTPLQGLTELATAYVSESPIGSV